MTTANPLVNALLEVPTALTAAQTAATDAAASATSAQAGAAIVGSAEAVLAAQTAAEAAVSEAASYASSAGSLINIASATKIGQLASTALSPSYAPASTYVAPKELLRPTVAQVLAMPWTTTAGRWYKTATGWVQAAANTARPYYDESGDLLGFLQEGADTFYSAPWQDSTQTHTSTDYAYLVKTVSTDTIVYAGANTQPDIHGGTGKCVELTQVSTANGVFYANNVTANTVSGDNIRIEALVSFPSMGTAPAAADFSLRCFVKSGTNPTRLVTLALDATGTPTGWSATPTIDVYRAGYTKAGVKSDGNAWYYVWMEYRSTGTAVIGPSVGLPTLVAGRKAVIHDLRIRVNPTSPPRIAPVLAAAKTFAADVISTGVMVPMGVLWNRQARCRTLITNGQISHAPIVMDGANIRAISGPYHPYENSLVLIQSGETADVPGILPNEYQSQDFTPWLTPTTWTVPLGPAYFNQVISVALSAGCANMVLKPCFTADVMLMPQVYRYQTSPTYLTGNLTLDGTVINTRSWTRSSQFQQSDIGSGGSMNLFTCAGSVSAQRCLFVSHPQILSRARGEAQADDVISPSNSGVPSSCVYMGECTYTLSGSGGSITLDDSASWRVGRPINVTGASTTTATAYSAKRFFADETWSDHQYFGYGAFSSLTFDNAFLGRTTCALSDFYQTRYEVEVNTGSGWQGLAASGLAYTALPLGRRASFFGTRDMTTGVVTEAPIADRTCIVRNFSYPSVGTNIANTPGYQFNASQPTWPNENRFPSAGDTYVIAQDAAPSAATPWVRLTFDLGYWGTSGTYTVTAGAPATANSGTHPDSCQTNITYCAITSLSSTGFVVFGRVAGPFLQADGSTAGFQTVGFTNFVLITDNSWGIYAQNSKFAGSVVTATGGVALPMTSLHRNSDGSEVSGPMYTAIGANTTLALNNMWAGFEGGGTPASASSSGTVTGTPTIVDTGIIAGYAVTPPSAAPMIEQFVPSKWLDPYTYQVRGDIHPLDPNFRFTDYACIKTGLPLNAILTAARGTHVKWEPLKASIGKYHRTPDVTVSVSASAAVGTVVATGLRSSAWLERFSGAEGNYFAISNGQVTVAKSLVGINAVWLLITAADETILLDIQ